MDKNSLLFCKEFGYNSFDTATGYNNARILREVIKPSDLIITKFNPGYFDNIEMVAQQHVVDLGKLPDIVLIHSPLNTSDLNISAFKSLKSIFPKQLIGISNFSIKDTENLLENGCQPDIMSCEFHPFYQPNKLLSYCQSKDITVLGYRCLAKGEINSKQQIINLAKKYDATPSQIVLKWISTKNIIPIASSSKYLNLKENLSYEKVELNNEDINLLDSLNREEGGSSCMLRYCQHDK